MSQIQAHRRKTYWFFIFFAWFFATLYTLLVDGFENLFPFINTSIIGILLGIIAAVFELEIFRKYRRNFKFYQILIIRTLLYLFLITFIIFFELAIARVFKYGMTLSEVLKSEEFNNYLLNEDFVYAVFYALVLLFLFNFSRQIVKKLGHGVFLNFITGRYVKPVIENRIVMFINIRNTGDIIKKLGRLRFHSFLNEFVSDITESIISYKGRIYEYVDDQVVVIWDLQHGQRNANCIRAFFEAKDRLTEQKEKYFKEYGIFPRITAALHRGDLVHGELGYVKSNIVYSGDVMNTTSRVLDACEEHQKDILVTGELLSDIHLPSLYQSLFCGQYSARGRKGVLDIYTILEKEIQYI
jgi:adenylate cyclase